MQENLKRLLTQIGLNENFFSFFENGKLERIVGNKDHNHYCFEIELEELLPIEVFLVLKELLKSKLFSS